MRNARFARKTKLRVTAMPEPVSGCADQDEDVAASVPDRHGTPPRLEEGIQPGKSRDPQYLFRRTAFYSPEQPRSSREQVLPTDRNRKPGGWRPAFRRLAVEAMSFIVHRTSDTPSG